MSVTGALWNKLMPHAVLNTPQGAEKLMSGHTLDGKNSVDFAVQINKAILNLYSNFLSEDGHHVDYVGMGKSDQFKEFLNQVQKLTQVVLETLSEDERKAFFLNIYNALVIHGYIELGVPASGKKRLSFFQTVSYQIGPHTYSLDDIEHGILRGNKKHPAFFFLHPQFEGNDPRKQFCLPCDPRIHFALVCGAKSCPPLRLYTPDNLSRGLDLAARAFLSDTNNFKVVDYFNRKVELSQIFKWYRPDFPGENDNATFLRFLEPFLPSEDTKKELGYLLDPPPSTTTVPPITFIWTKYDWHTNGDTN